MSNSPQYLFDAKDKPSLPLHEIPLLQASEETTRGYGFLVDDPARDRKSVV